MMEGTIKIGVVEYQILFREGIKAILNQKDNFDVIFERADGFSVIDKLEKMPVRPDVLLIDLSLPPQHKKEYSGLHLIIDLVEKFPQIKLLILSRNVTGLVTFAIRNNIVQL